MHFKETDRSRLLRIRAALLATVLVAATPAFPAAAGAPTSGDATVTAAIGPGTARLGRKAELPSILSASDAQAYQRIFELQKRAQWAMADRERARLNDDVLDGVVLAQRYLHPLYKSKFPELKEWMARHADHAEATTIHKLAKQRMGKGDRGLKPPSVHHLPVSGIGSGDDATGWEVVSIDGGQHLSSKDRGKLRSLKSKFRSLVRNGKEEAALALLKGPDLRRLADKIDLDELSTVLAANRFSAGNDVGALNALSDAVERSGHVLPQAHWIAGLAHWRRGSPDKARRHFEAVANARGSGWMVSAGAYWAARANLVAKRPEVVNHWLEIAADHPRTFYGLLARRALGMSLTFAWEGVPFTDVDSELLQRVPTGRRALALLQLGMTEGAEQELRRLAPQATPQLTRAMLALANTAELPELAVQLGGRVAQQNGRFHDSAAFPVPTWTPSGGWKVDRALVLAIARQESGFDPNARSHAGAVGLMQIMPATAKSLAGETVPLDRLREPTYNLALGQAYIKFLLSHPAIGGNLFKLAAAYNSGPGNLERWLSKLNHADDPLLFAESIPSRETRGFVKKTMTNLWIYRARLGQPMASLDAVVAGDWPRYDELDGRKRPTNKKKPAAKS